MATDLAYFATDSHHGRKGLLSALEEARLLLADAGVRADDVVSIQQSQDSGNVWYVSGWYRTREA